MRDATRDAMRDAIRFFASLIASLELRDAKFLANRIPLANFRDATKGCDPIASLIMHSLLPSPMGSSHSFALSSYLARVVLQGTVIRTADLTDLTA